MWRVGVGWGGNKQYTSNVRIQLDVFDMFTLPVGPNSMEVNV